ncbi:MAG TPA: hypothetical protein VFE32_04580 [Puia sp.]|nr:hypothetical protein [Puia sp.]
MKQATTRTLSTAKYIEAQSSTLGFRNGLCFIGTLLKAHGGASTINVTLTGGTSYAFIGGGDDDVTDIDIKISNTGGTILAQDTKNDNYPVVEFTPEYSGTYEIKLLNWSPTLAFCAVAILEEGGVGLPVDNIGDAVEKIFRMCRSINNQTTSKVWFLDEDNQWCFYGYVLGNSDNRTVSNIKMGGGVRYVMAAADDNAGDIDACIMNGAADEEYHCDKEPDATPIVKYNTSGYADYGIKITDAKSSGKTFVLACILKEGN